MKRLLALTFVSAAIMAWPLTGQAEAQAKPDVNDPAVTVVTVHAAPRNDRVFNGGHLLTLTVTQAANLRELADQAGYDGESQANILFVVPAGTTITGETGGGKGIETGRWPAGVSLGLAINGRVCGGGGKGGDGWGQTGGKGGDAIFVQVPILIVVAEKGAVESGGGGGGGARPAGGLAAGGGGGGFPNGGFGLGISGGDNGREGNSSGGGRGGNNHSLFRDTTSIPPFDRGNQGIFASSGPSVIPGGNGGDPGMDGGYVVNGGAGGSAGYAVKANGNSVQFVVAGRVRGQVG